MISIRSVTAADAPAWLAMRRALWPEGPDDDHGAEVDTYFAASTPARPAEVLVAEAPDGTLVGFAELAIRPYAEGCATDRVGYLEGWYVAEGARRSGVGRRLVEAAEAWARSRGCSEFASDADPDNDVSVTAHLALGFSDAGLVRCFRKTLDP